MSGQFPQLRNFEILSELGHGGMGIVYKAHQHSLDRTVALKVLDPVLARDAHYLKRFRREARLAAKINHPNAVTVFDVREENGRHFIVMEYVDGSSLEENLHGGPMPEGRALAIVRAVADALHDAHRKGIIHRDIKPANILLTADGTPKLSDLGIAKQVWGSASLSLTRSGNVLGTPYYMSPEQCQSLEDIDGRSDIYSLGITLYHVVTGRPPFSGPSPLAVMKHHLDTPLPDPRSVGARVSRPLTHLLRAMTAKDRAQRIPDCRTLVAQIDRVLRGQAPAVPQEEIVTSGIEVIDVVPWGVSRPRTARGRLRWAIAGTSLAAVIAVAVILSSGPPPPEVQKFVNEAEKAAEEGDWERAYEYYGKARKAGGSRAKLSRAMNDVRQRQLRAAELYKMQEWWYRNCVRTGSNFAQKGDWERAQKALKDAVELGATMKPPPADLRAIRLRLSECEEHLRQKSSIGSPPS